MFIPTIRKVSLPERGPTSSRILNDFIDQAVTDIHTASNEISLNSKRVNETMKIVLDEVRYLNRKIRQIEGEKEAERLSAAKNGIRVTYHQSASKTDNVSFLSSNIALRPVINGMYGIVHLPVNSVESKFFSTAIWDGDILVPTSLSVRVNSTFIPEGQTSLVNFDKGASKVIEGYPNNAFNGNNRSYWMREVHFPASSDVTEVQAELIVTIPSQNNSQSNVLNINPYPVGSVDVIDISVSSDLTSSFTRLNHPDAPTLQRPMNGAGFKKFIFPPTDIDQVRVRLRCRNFVEEDNKKIFRFGLQELGLFLVDYEKSTSSLEFSDWVSKADAENISCVYKIDAPKGHAFRALHRFDSSPDILLENDISRHIVFRVYDGNPITGTATEIWNSNLTYPQNQPDSIGGVLVNGTTPTFYVVATMRYISGSTGSSGPFKSNTSPYLNSFSMEVSAVPTN